ncbi:MAG: hypothetical protein FJY85_07820, partial [Deltaproteobacteria bacterium]|nr:hypothetical protein [Deltaproteobacteria bacterium]
MTFRELDIVFLSFREPQKEQFWTDLKSLVPWARRVDGVRGFLAAFRRCAEVARTEHFLMIDGDTRLLDSFDPDMKLPALDQESVLTWASRNAINGLVYGNGCLKLWPKRRLLEMTSNDGFRRASGYFIDDIRYARQPGLFSETSPNGSPEQAFTYGFREALRFCVEGNLRPKPAHADACQFLGSKHRMLQIICGVGSDVVNGIWANIGAVEAVRYHLDGGAQSVIGDYDWLSAAGHRTSRTYDSRPGQLCRRAIEE